MKIPRNAFYMRYSEKLGSDAMFLKLFSPGILEALPGTNIWENLVVFRSAPGGGKTSLMRLFTPESLTTLHSHKKQDGELYAKLKELGALDDNGPTVLGTIISCFHDYSALEDLDLDSAKRERLFLALLNVRIILSGLRSALVLRRLNYPEDLGRLHIKNRFEFDLPKGVPTEGSGEEYFEWARRLEAEICDTVDSILPTEEKQFITGHDSLFGLWLIHPNCLHCDGSPIAEKSVVMLDDIYKLRSSQRHKLAELLPSLRAPTRVWIAERLQALNSDELFESGSKIGRDWIYIPLEAYWRDHSRRFEAFVSIVADKRADESSGGQVSSFVNCLQSAVDTLGRKEGLERALETVSKRTRVLAGSRPEYQSWLAAKETVEGSVAERLMEWRMLEVILERTLRKKQKAFDFLEFNEADLEAQEQSDVRNAAELFLHREFKFPYYFSFSKLCAAASSNVEQFLDLSGELFERIFSASLLTLSRTKLPEINPEKQEQILKQAAAVRWKEMIHRVNNPADARALLEAIGKYCEWETYKPNAPYSPGVTGVAISMADRDKLRDPVFLEKNPSYQRLARVIADCLSNNLLEPIVDRKCKGKRWMRLHLNRLLCLHFNLPLTYNGWKEKSLKELATWLDKGFQPSRKHDEFNDL